MSWLEFSLRSRKLARRRRAARLVLETAEANRAAQALYEDFGFVRAQGFFTYTLALD